MTKKQAELIKTTGKSNLQYFATNLNKSVANVVSVTLWGNNISLEENSIAIKEHFKEIEAKIKESTEEALYKIINIQGNLLQRLKEIKQQRE